MDNYIKSATDYVINSKTRDLKGLLGNKGEEPQGEEEYDDPENWSKRELEQEIDAALVS